MNQVARKEKTSVVTGTPKRSANGGGQKVSKHKRKTPTHPRSGIARPCAATEEIHNKTNKREGISFNPLLANSGGGSGTRERWDTKQKRDPSKVWFGIFKLKNAAKN